MKQANPKLWARQDACRELVANAQKWINTYHEEMVQLGILTP